MRPPTKEELINQAFEDYRADIARILGLQTSPRRVAQLVHLLGAVAYLRGSLHSLGGLYPNAIEYQREVWSRELSAMLEKIDAGSSSG